MDLVSTVLVALLFAAFVPGVLVRLPPRGGRMTVLVLHAVLFSAVLCMVMTWYWKGREHMGNYGEECPNGYAMMSDGNCVPTGRATYNPSAPSKSSAQ
jgi:hypothetical protein